VRWRDFRVTVDANHKDVTYTLSDGDGGDLTIRHAGEEVVLNTEKPRTIAVRRRKPLLPPPPQPPGREPMHRHTLAQQAPDH
jgi:alpha,alpha-trehalose phosphorylase